MIREIKTYGVLLIDMTLFMIASLSELDLEIRIITACLALVVMVLTIYKVHHQTRKVKLENKILEWSAKIEEEKARRFFEQKYNQPKQIEIHDNTEAD